MPHSPTPLVVQASQSAAASQLYELTRKMPSCDPFVGRRSSVSPSTKSDLFRFLDGTRMPEGRGGAAMMGLHRAEDRRHEDRAGRSSWVTFPRSSQTGGQSAFGLLEGAEEILLVKGARSQPLPHHRGDTVTYVHDGAVAYASSRGDAGVVYAGEFRRVTGMARAEQREANGSHTDPALLFRMRLADTGRPIEPHAEQRRFGIADRRAGLCIVASRDGRAGSLHLQQDAVIYSAVLAGGQHLVHEVRAGRWGWLQVVAGELRLRDERITAGDGWSFGEEQRISLLGDSDCEILLVDLPASGNNKP
ncbi:MAG: pirin family protein [Myxococcales bacterium]|nr:pirin family protein [Myxococcales bacterium]